MQTQTSIKDLMDSEVTDSSGHKIGTVKQVYLNDVSGEPEWVRVHTGWFGTRESFVPLADARRTDNALRVPYDKDKVKHAPSVDADQHLSREQVSDLYRYYGLHTPGGRQAVSGQGGPAGEGRTQGAQSGQDAEDTRSAQEMRKGAPGTGAPEAGRRQAPRGQAAGERAPREKSVADPPAREQTRGAQAQRARTDPTAKAETMRTAHGRVAGEQGAAKGAPGDQGMIELTLSEERVRVGTERHESERVNLRKRIEVEQIERTVAVYREELRIEREPIAEGEAVAGGTYRIGEDEREFILYEERPMISKEIIPVERIRVRAERVAGEQTVRDEIRKERIDIAHQSAEDAPSARPDMGRGGAGRGTGGRNERKRPER